MGNPNPSPETRFKKGCKGNPGGMTAEYRKKVDSNAETAVSIREKILKQLEAQIDGIIEDGEALNSILGHLNPHTLKMLKDAEDRGLGAPVQAVISPDGSMSPKDVDGKLVAALVEKLTD